MTFIDSPMFGAILKARAGTITFIVGTDDDAEFERANLVLKGMGENIIRSGGPGTGQIVKIVNNQILGIYMIAAAEGLVLGEKLGMDKHKL